MVLAGPISLTGCRLVRIDCVVYMPGHAGAVERTGSGTWTMCRLNRHGQPTACTIRNARFARHLCGRGSATPFSETGVRRLHEAARIATLQIAGLAGEMSTSVLCWEPLAYYSFFEPRQEIFSAIATATAFR